MLQILQYTQYMHQLYAFVQMNDVLFLGLGRKINDYNLPRECIKRYFPSRKCFVFPFPVTSQEDMTRLEILQDQDLAQQFLEVTGHFCDHMFVNSDVKRLKGGHIVTGQCECFIHLNLLHNTDSQ